MSIVDDLIVVCADAPNDADRRQADALLCRELVARLRIGTREYDLDAFKPSITSENAAGGVARARAFWINRTNPVANAALLGRGSTPRFAAPSDFYDAMLEQIEEEGAPLVADVQSAMGAAFNSLRRELNGWCAPAGSHVLYPITEMLASPGDGVFRTGSGTRTVQLVGDFWTSNPASPATLNIDFNGTTLSPVRNSANVDEPVHVNSQISVGGGPAALHVGNGSAFAQRARAMLRTF